MSDNKLSRQLHENGVQHKQKVEQLSRKKREEKLHGARSEIDLKRQLAEIEKAAGEAIAADRLGALQSNSLGQFFKSQPAPPPPLTVRTNTSYIPRDGAFKPREEESSSSYSELNDNRGIYTVDGKTYLEGKKFESKIWGGTRCEVFDESLDEWMEGEVIKRNETPIPNTEMYILSFDVEYKRVDPAAQRMHTDEVPLVTESGIKSDRIRLLGTANGELLIPYQDFNLPAAPIIDENTGIGMWQTVSVKVVDEEENETKQSQIDVVLKEEREVKTQSAKESSHADSALDAYDPYNTRMYKGVALHEIVISNAEVEPLSVGGEVVQFKKKRRHGSAIQPKAATSSAPASSSSSISAGTENNGIVTAEPIAESKISELEKSCVASDDFINHEMAPHETITVVMKSGKQRKRIFT